MYSEKGRVSASWIWWRWVVANGAAEFVGLTSTLAMAAGSFAANDRVSLPVGIGIALGIAATGALVEGIAVGGLQWLVLRRPLPELRLRGWVIATSLGAFVAWALGMLPSTIISAAQAASVSGASAPAAAFDPPLWLQLLMAAGMGLVLGPFLGVPQWRVLRPHLPRAGWWVLANVTAWALGMPMIFLATSLISAGDSTAVTLAYVAAGCLAAGLVVGMVHGVWLVLMLGSAGLLSQRAG